MEVGNLLSSGGWSLGTWRLDSGTRLTGYLLGSGMVLGVTGGRWEAFKTNVHRARRRPELSVMVEGYGSVTDKVKNITLRRLIKDSLHEPLHGQATVVLQNSDGTLIENGRSVIRRNDKVSIWAGFGRQGYRSGDLVPRFTGVVNEPTISTESAELILSLNDYGYLMKQAQTSGDFSDYNTPKLLVNELLSRLNLGPATWENEDGLPSTYIIGNTTLNRRNYWRIVHGVLLGIGYVFFFSGDGTLQCIRRDSSSESEECFKDTDIITLGHLRMAEFFNEKSVDLADAAPVEWSATAGDGLRWGQSTYTQTSDVSQAMYGVSADYEAEETLSEWDNILPYVRDSVLWFKYPRGIYELRCPARPYIDIIDKVRIDSSLRNVHGQMTTIGINEYISSGTYTQALTLMTHREFF